MWKRLAALVGAVFFLGAPVAFAGGPTSVIVVDPSTAKTAALYNSDTDYTALMAALGPDPVKAEGPDLHAAPSTTVTITWLVHDVQIWRTDHVFMDEQGGPWVETSEWTDGPPNFDQRGVVHKAANPKALTELLNNLLGKPKTAVAVSAPVPPPAPVRPSGLQWGSLLVGAAAGALVVVVFGLVRRATSR
ncbi:hypothetical protein [Actinocrispum wychmicini]|uniref:Uncharacterized protein n=1 Tax=Actinocrispum wychmicini TaxID=1213861 RepID=A0A4R2JZF2_9PSEU|nr:hypothetical protein [Actinocrispum wychmicini]TCO62679.1 hypothetical protein EV192_102818 [Actinocrispum wychmicini]